MTSFLPSQIPGFKDSLFLAVLRRHLIVLLCVGQEPISPALWLLESAGTNTLKGYFSTGDIKSMGPTPCIPPPSKHLPDMNP